jgi:hypothetical protein
MFSVGVVIVWSAAILAAVFLFWAIGSRGLGGVRWARMTRASVYGGGSKGIRVRLAYSAGVVLATMLLLLGCEMAGVILGLVGASGIIVDHAIFRKRRRRKFLERLVAKEYRVCPQCLYALCGSSDEGKCPECGLPYSGASLVEQWKQILRIPAARKGLEV